VGLFNDYTDTGIRGNVDDGRFATLYFKEDTLIAIDAVNDPVSFMAGKQLLKKRLLVSKDKAMGATMLKDLLGGNKNRRSSN
tara:strand:+ start:304 stop:549 length:246 start_codon:yes stop_codon:yes gene_type:complete